MELEELAQKSTNPVVHAIIISQNKKKNLYSQQVEKQLRVALQNMVVLTD